MNGDRLSTFIEANRFPPAINERRYSILRAQTDAIAERISIIANNRLSKAPQLYEVADMSRFLANHIHELEANEISTIDQSSSPSLELLVLPRISVMSSFNPFDDPISSPSSPVPDQLKPAAKTNTVPSTATPSSEPPTDYLPFIPTTAPFAPYEEKYEPHPAGLYGAKKFKNRQTMSSAPLGFERPVTPTFSDTNSSFARFSDTSSSDQAVTGAECSPASTSQSSCSPPRTPLFRPFKIPRKPLPPGARPFPPVSYTPPDTPSPPVSYTPCGSPICNNSHRSTEVATTSTVPRRPRHARSNAICIRSPFRYQIAPRKPRLDLHKALPPSPAPPANTSQRQRPVVSSHRAGSNQEESRRVSRQSDHGMVLGGLRSPTDIPTPMKAADRVRSELRDVKVSVWNKMFSLRRS
jgi:hypothetical protein